MAEYKISVKNSEDGVEKGKKLISSTSFEKGEPGPCLTVFNAVPSFKILDPMGLPILKHLEKCNELGCLIPESVALTIINKTIDILQKEHTVLEVQAPAFVCGDLLGQYEDLINIVRVCEVTEGKKMILLGNYTGLKKKGVETLIYVCSLKICYPDSIKLLRGTMDNLMNINEAEYYSFKTECLEKYSEKIHSSLLKVLNCLPLAVLLNKQYLCLYGGVTKSIRTIKDLESLNRFSTLSTSTIKKIVWAKPAPDYDYLCTKNKEKAKVEDSTYYSYIECCKFLSMNNLRSIICAAPESEWGIQFHRKHSDFPSVICVSGVPNVTVTNEQQVWGSVLEVTEEYVKTVQFWSSKYVPRINYSKMPNPPLDILTSEHTGLSALWLRIRAAFNNIINRVVRRGEYVLPEYEMRVSDAEIYVPPLP